VKSLVGFSENDNCLKERWNESPARSVVTANFLLYLAKGEVKSLLHAGNDREILNRNCEKMRWHTNCMAYDKPTFDPEGVFFNGY